MKACWRFFILLQQVSPDSSVPHVVQPMLASIVRHALSNTISCSSLDNRCAKNIAHALGIRILRPCLACKLACWSYAFRCLQTGRAQDGSDEDDNTEPTHQSPWELFDEGLDAQQAVREGPALDSPVADRLKHAVQALSASEHFELFVDLLDPDAAYPASDTGGTLLSSGVLGNAMLSAMPQNLLFLSHKPNKWSLPVSHLGAS